jgi:Mn-dependent DtxR family transcriptional regulator
MYHRPAPTVDALIALLKQDTTGIGVTTAELAERMNKSTVTISAALGRMRAYGYVSKSPANNNGRFPQELVRWKVRD